MSGSPLLAVSRDLTAQPFLDSQMQSRWWDFGGDTVIRTDRYVRLTGELTSRAGWIFSRVPLTATNWEVRCSPLSSQIASDTDLDRNRVQNRRNKRSIRRWNGNLADKRTSPRWPSIRLKRQIRRSRNLHRHIQK